MITKRNDLCLISLEKVTTYMKCIFKTALSNQAPELWAHFIKAWSV